MATNLKVKARRSPASNLQTVRGSSKQARLAERPLAPSATLLNLGLAFSLALLTLTVYSPVGGHPFIEYDDQVYVTNNAHVKAGLSWDTFTWAWTATEASNWHPITWLSHAADCEFYGLNASGHHWTSLLIHALNVVLLFFLLQRVTGATWRSLFVAALFALHPLNVESVAWIAERKNVLSTTFFLLALGAYGWYARRPGMRRYAMLAILFALGLATKPMVITLPFVLLLLDFWPLQRIENWTAPSQAFPVVQAPLSRLVLEKLPLLALSAGSAVITVVAQKLSVVPAQVLPLEVRLQASLYAYAMYIWKAFWPVNLALIYPHPGRTLGFGKPFLGALMIVAVSVLGWAYRVSRPYIAVGWLWYLGTAVPIIGIMQVGVQVVADRYAYVPLLGVFVIISWTLLPPATGMAPRPARAVAAALIVAMLGLLTWRQIGYWQTTADVWSHALQVTDGNTMAENFLANALFASGRYQEAMSHLRNYASLEPLDPNAHARVAADSQDNGQLAEAIKEYTAAIHATEVLRRYGSPGMTSESLAVTYANLGVAYAQSGDEEKARENTSKALDTDGEAVEKMINGLAQAIAAQPAASGYIRLGTLLQQVGRFAEAQQAFEQAHRLDPSVPRPSVSTQR